MPLVVFRFNENEPESNFILEVSIYKKIDVNIGQNFSIKLFKIFKIRLQFNFNFGLFHCEWKFNTDQRLFGFNDISYFVRVIKQVAINRYK